MTNPMRIAVIVGSTRAGRRGRMVGDWVVACANRGVAARGPVTVELVDLADVDLPLLDEPAPAAVGDYAHEHTRQWSRTVAGFDAFVLVTPEYNHSYPAALKNAIDHLFGEWHDKAVGFVTYGIQGGVRAAEHLRPVMAEVGAACVRTQVALALFADFTLENAVDPGECTPADRHEELLDRMLGEVVAWGTALAPLRARREETDGVPA